MECDGNIFYFCYIAKNDCKLQTSRFIPIYQRLTSYYRDRIIRQQIPPESRMDSINKMMERHKVSRETAKLVLRNLVEAGLVESKVGQGSFVTANTELKKEWGIVIPFHSSNLETLIGFLNDEAQKRGRKISYFLGYNDPEEEIKLVGSMIRNGLEAVIIVPNYDESLTSDFYRNLKQGNTRIVLADNTMAGSYFNYVIQSYDLGVKRAFDYLTFRNNKNLLFVKNEPWRRTNLVHELMEHTLKIFIQQQTNNRNLFVINDLSMLKRNFILENQIGGILTSSDIDSVRIVGRLRSWNIKIPEGISVVSYGNTELTNFFSPSITAIDCKYSEMAQRTVKLIFDKTKKTHPEQHVIQPELVIRET